MRNGKKIDHKELDTKIKLKFNKTVCIFIHFYGEVGIQKK